MFSWKSWGGFFIPLGIFAFLSMIYAATADAPAVGAGSSGQTGLTD
jgi:hypothetical protein